MNYSHTTKIVLQPNYHKLPFSIILFLTIILAVPAGALAVMQSPSYRIDYERISSGGGVEGTDSYQMLESLGEFGSGVGSSDNYQVGAGEAYGMMADVTPAPTLLNNGSYNSLNFRINRGREYDDDSAMVLHLKFSENPVFDWYTTTGVASEEINTTSTTKIAQKFQTGTSTDFIGSVDVYQTTGDDLAGNFLIETDNAGAPSGTTVGNGTSTVSLNAGSETHVKLASSTQVVAGNIYWLVFAPTSGSGSFQGNTSGETDQVKVYDGNSWDLSSSTEAIYFRAYDRADDARDNHQGRISGALTTGGRYGRGLNFDGTDDYVEIANDSDLEGMTALTLEAWIYPEDNSQLNKVISKTPPSDQDPWNLYFLGIAANGAAQTCVSLGVAGSLTCATADDKIDLNQWHHLAGTYDGTQIKLYLDGILAKSANKNGTVGTSNQPVWIGANLWDTVDTYFDGIIDEVAIYDRALSANEISRYAQVANPSDAEYAIAISDDNWDTTRYIQTDNTVGDTLVWQTYANWGSGTGELVSGLESDVTYRIKVKSRHGDFTETGWSVDTSAKTSLVSLSFSVSANACDFGSLVPNQVSECTTILDIDANAASGYQTTIIEDHDLRDEAGKVIADVSDGAVDRGEEYGIRTSGSIDGQMNDQDYAVTLSPQVVALKTGPALARQTIVTYKIVISAATLAGEYSQTVSYVTTGTY